MSEKEASHLLIHDRNILVIGASGFLGKHLVQRLASRDFTVHATHLPGESTIPLPGVTWATCDLGSSDFESRFPSRCDAVVYLAQSPHWRDFPAGAADVFRVNVAATLRAAEYARRAGVRRFLYASSGSVYTQTVRPTLENEPLDLNSPRSYYSASKLASELLLGPYAALFSVVILRLFVPYGVGQHRGMLIPQLVRRVGEGCPIELHGAEGMRINPVAAADVAEALERCLALDESATLNVAGPQILSLREVGVLIGQALGREPQFKQNDDQIPPFIVGDLSSLRRRLNWIPSITFERGLSMWRESDRAIRDLAIQGDC